MQDIIETIKSKAKQLTLDIAQLGDKSTKDQLYNDSLELLFNIHELETLYNKNYSASQESYTNTQKTSPSIDQTSDDIIKEEISKIQRKLPNWAIKQHQINSKILTLYLQLKEDGKIDITENMLMEKYGNQSEFYRNFPQMKGISPKNHGKIFDVQNGLVKIWEPIQDIVHEYKQIVFKV